MRDIDVLFISTPNIDIHVADGGRFPDPGQEIRVDSINVAPGGGGTITAMVLARLGMAPYMYCTLGDDLFALHIRYQLEREGIRLESRGTGGPTGISVALDIHRDRRFLTFDGSVNDISPAHAPRELLARARHIHLTNYRGPEDFDEYDQFLDTAHNCGTTVSMDMCWDETGRWDPCTLKLGKKADIFFSNETEICHYLGETDLNRVLEKLVARRIPAVIKMGRRGAAAVGEGRIVTLPAQPVTAVDTTGAGDAFNAGYLYRYLQGGDLQSCLRVGNICGALSVAGVGGCPATLQGEAVRAAAAE